MVACERESVNANHTVVGTHVFGVRPSPSSNGIRECTRRPHGGADTRFSDDAELILVAAAVSRWYSKYSHNK